MTLTVNLLGGPGSGKSTTAAALFALLKRQGYKTELVTEYAKDLVYEGSGRIGNQLHVFSEQYLRIERLQGKVDIIVTDGALINSVIYASGKFEGPWWEDFVRRCSAHFRTLNIFLNRVKPYAAYGRLQDEVEARAIDRLIRRKLYAHAQIDGDARAPARIASIIESIEPAGAAA